ARDAGLKLLIGAEVTPQDGPPLVLLATDRPSYGRLADLLSRGKMRAPKGECHLTLEDVAACAAGLLACLPLPEKPEKGVRTLFHVKKGPAPFFTCRDIFRDRCYALAELHRGPNDPGRLQRLRDLARRLRLPLAAANGVLYHDGKRQFLHHVLTA